MNRSRVGLANRGSRRDNVFHAMHLVRDDLIPKVADQVMLKPNFLSSKNQLASSHADAIRGAIDFLLKIHINSPILDITLQSRGAKRRGNVR